MSTDREGDREGNGPGPRGDPTRDGSPKKACHSQTKYVSPFD